MRININLASNPYEAAREYTRRMGMLVAALAVIFVGLLGYILYQRSHNRGVNQEIEQAQQEIASLNAEKAKALATLNQPQNRQIADQSQFLNNLFARKALSWTRVFTELERMMPPNIHVISMKPEFNHENQLVLHVVVATSVRDKAVELVLQGRAEALMKGSLHTDELMHEVTAAETGLRTARRMSHAFVMDVPTYTEPVIITDAAINIFPTLDDKRDICQNAIDLAQILGCPEPRVAVLSAVETVTAKIPSTLEAAALSKMADRGQITGGLVDGPLAFDNAVSEQAAQEKHIVSPVAGKANILLVPDLEAGNMLAKQLTFMSGADAAGIVLGARIPIILTSRADNLRTRLASAAAAVLIAHARRQAVPKAIAAE